MNKLHQHQNTLAIEQLHKDLNYLEQVAKWNRLNPFIIRNTTQRMRRHLNTIKPNYEVIIP